MSCSEVMSNGLLNQLKLIQQKLEVVLPDKYNTLCSADPQRRQSYTLHFDQFTDDMTARIANLHFRILSVTTSNVQPVQQPSPFSQHHPQILKNLPRLGELKFSGKVEDWPEFKRNWMSRYSTLNNDTQLQYLKPALPVKDQPKVSALTSMDQCWERLDKVYGNKQLNIIIEAVSLSNQRLV